MSILELSDFQITTAAALVQLLRRQEQKTTLQAIEGEAEAYLYVHWKNLEFFIYEDGAGVIGSDIDERFEAPDYAGLDDLSRSFLDCVEKLTTKA